MKTIALIGNPNSGKTTLFNALTGSSAQVGNWPGVTVEKKEGYIKKNKDLMIVDLPGIYSLSPYSKEEVVSRNFLIKDKPDYIINIVDGTNIERNLYLTTQVLEAGIPTIIALNMMDVVEKRGDTVDAKLLEKNLGCKVIPISAATSKGIVDLVSALEEAKMPKPIKYQSSLETAIENISSLIDRPYSRWVAVKLLENDMEGLDRYPAEAVKTAEKERIALEKAEEDEMMSIIASARYDVVTEIIRESVKKHKNGLSTSDKIDKIITNKWLGLPIFFLIMWAIYFISITTVGDWTIGGVEAFFAFISGSVESFLIGVGANEIVIAFICSGLIDSIGAIFTFVPQLMILFLFLSLLEDSGYMARVAFVMDRIFRKFGLSGKSFIPMLIGTGCSVPGIMASRTIEQENDRNMTILLTPFIPCGAKLPVFALFIGMIFNGAGWVGPSIYLIGILGVILFGLILKRTKYFKGDPAPFVMELPDYMLPRVKGVLTHMWEKAKGFIIKAGTIIFVACAVIWFLQSFSFGFQYVGDEIEKSMLAGIGGVIRYLFIPLGFGDSWVGGVAVISGLVAKEIIVATFATVGAVIPVVFSKVTAFSFMIFTIFSAPCAAAIGATRREMGSLKKTLAVVGFQTGVAYILAALVNLVGNLIFKGTEAVQKIALDYSVMEEISENDVLSSGTVGGVILAALVIGLVVIAIVAVKKYKKDGTLE